MSTFDFFGPLSKIGSDFTKGWTDQQEGDTLAGLILGMGGQPKPTPVTLASLGTQQPTVPSAPQGLPAAAPSFAANAGPTGSYLDMLIRKESGGDPSAKSPTSSATGLGQFTNSTWAGVSRAHPELGLTPDGRTDPEQSKRAIAAFTTDNAAILNKADIDPTPGNLYMTHFLGAGGGPKFLAAMRDNPNAPAASLVGPDQVAANKSIFYGPDGTPRTAAQVYSRMAGGFGGATVPGQGQGQPQVAAADLPAPDAQPAQFAVPGQPSLGPVRPPADPSLPAVGAGASGPNDAQRATIAALVRSPGTRAAGLSMLQQLQSKKSFSAPFSYQGGTFQLGSDGELKAVIAPKDLAPYKDDAGNTYTFDPRSGSFTKTIEGKDSSVKSLITPDDRRKYGVDPEYKGPVQVDADGKLSYPGRPATEINMSAEKAQDSKIGGAYGETFNDMQKGGRDASGQLNTFRIMEKLIEHPSFYSGTGGERMTSLRRAAASLGIAGADTAAPNELFAKLANQSVIDKLGGNLGQGVSNADVGFMTRTTANLENTPEGNRQIIQFGKALAQRQIDVAKLSREYAKTHNGRLDAGFDDVLSSWAEAHPMFPEQTAAQAGATPATVPAPAAPQAGPAAQPAPAAAARRIGSPQEYQTLRPGDTYTAPDGSVRTKR